MIEPGSGEAIKVQGTKTLNEFLKLLDEILHAFDGIDLIGNAHWRYRFCKWVHERGL